MPFGALLYSYGFESFPTQMLFTLGFSLEAAVESSLKMYFHNPRPYFVDSRIEIFDDCSSGYGNPSGHSMQSNFWALFLHLHFFKGFGTKSLIVFFFVTLPFMLTMPLSRLYLGVHGADQVFLGMQLGVFLALFLFYGLKTTLIKHFKKMADLSIGEEEQTKGLRICFAVTYISTLIFLVIYLYDEYLFEIPSTWTLCATVKKFKSFHYAGLDNAMESYFAVSSYLSFYLSQKQNYALEKPSNAKEIIWRYARIIYLGIIPALVFEQVFYEPVNFLVLILFISLTPFLCMGLILFYLTPKINEKRNAKQLEAEMILIIV